jgi:copper chaperone
MSQSVSLIVTGMKCGGCEANVKSRLQALTGVSSVEANHKMQQVQIEFDADQVNLSTLIQTIQSAGYRVQS